MAATYANFVEKYPEFAATAQPQVEALLADALVNVDADVWGAKADQGQMLLTAHLLALSPYGNNAELAKAGSGKDDLELTTYGGRFKKMALQVGASYRVMP